jgi:hypothetical protein
MRIWHRRRISEAEFLIDLATTAIAPKSPRDFDAVTKRQDMRDG